MKIKIITILKALIFLFLLLKINFFYLVGFEYKYIFPFAGFIVCTLFSIVFLKKAFNRQRCDFRALNKYIIIVLISISILVLYTCVTFNKQDLSETIYLAYPFISIIFAIPLTIWIRKPSGETEIFRLLDFCAFIWYVVLIVQYFLYSKNGTVILQNYFYTGIATRNGNIRVDLQDFGNIMIVYNVYIFLIASKLSKKIVYGTLSALGFFSLVFVEQTRMYTLLIIISIAIIVVTLGENKKYRLLKNFAIIVSAILVFISTDIFQTLMTSFSIKGANSISTYNRAYAIDYYWSYFLKHPVFGFAFAHSEVYPSLVRGSEGLAAVSDVGIFGLLVRLGVFIIPIVGLYIYRILKIRNHLKKGLSNKQFALYNAMFYYLIFSFMTLSIFDQSRWLLYPLFIVLFEHKNLQLSSKENGSKLIHV